MSDNKQVKAVLDRLISEYAKKKQKKEPLIESEIDKIIDEFLPRAVPGVVVPEWMMEADSHNLMRKSLKYTLKKAMKKAVDDEQ